jgi:hypothetical protein
MMRLKELLGCVVFLGLSVVLTSSVSARAGEDDCKDSDHHDHDVNTPVGLVGVIPVPGNPITSADIAWVDPGTERYYFADRSNFGVDIIDAENNLWVGRVTGMAGPLPSGGGTTTTNGPGPNGVLVTPNAKLWAGDGNSTVQVADVNPESPNYLKILASVSTSIPDCDTGGVNGHYCGRADELGYDPKDHIILVANNAPRSATVAGHPSIDPYATFISAKPPYSVLGHIIFAGAGGLEQPLWNPEIQRFFLTVPGKASAGTNPSIAVINPITMNAGKPYTLDCQQLTGTPSSSITGIALGAFQHVLVSACGFPIILNGLNGQVFRNGVIKQVGGGDEVWYNSGDGRFYVTGPDHPTQPAPNPQSLGVIDAETNSWLQNVRNIRGKNPAAFAENNHIFTIVQINAAIVAAPMTDDSTCANFGFRGTGCIAVFTHSEKGDDNN